VDVAVIAIMTAINPRMPSEMKRSFAPRCPSPIIIRSIRESVGQIGNELGSAGLETRIEKLWENVYEVKKRLREAETKAR
jgi:hypothetical protein